MPLYEYRCRECGSQYEAYHDVDARDDDLCPECGGKTLRVYSSIGRPVVYEYWSESPDARITGPAQKARLLKERNLSEVG